MIKRKSEMKSAVKEQMRGGDGRAVVTDILSKGEYKGKARLVGTITLEPGCSIGAHVHEDEEEIFYVIEGEAVYNDNGKEEILYCGDSCICSDGQTHSIANRTSDKKLVIFALILTY